MSVRANPDLIDLRSQTVVDTVSGGSSMFVAVTAYGSRAAVGKPGELELQFGGEVILTTPACAENLAAVLLRGAQDARDAATLHAATDESAEEVSH